MKEEREEEEEARKKTCKEETRNKTNPKKQGTNGSESGDVTLIRKRREKKEFTTCNLISCAGGPYKVAILLHGRSAEVEFRRDKPCPRAKYTTCFLISTQITLFV
jgi:hypothetical protein